MISTGNRTRPALAVVVLAGVVACGSLAAPSRRTLDGAIARAEGFLQQRGVAVDPLMTYVLARLERRYGLTWTSEHRRLVLAQAPASAQVRLFARLVDPGVRLDPVALATLTNESDRIILSALYCPELGAPSPEVVGRFAAKGGTDVSHAALALQWSVENGCLSAHALETLRRQIVLGLVEEAARAPAADVGIEAMAMLDYVGASERIAPTWVEAVLASQHADGGWGERPGDPSNDHTTVLALWVVLAVSGRPAADVPWIPPA